MSYEFDPQEVKTRLDECMEDGKLREILAKEGIPQSEPTTLSIICIDNNNMDVITDYEILTISPEVPVTPTEIDFEREINDFLDHTEASHGLLGKLPMSDQKQTGRGNAPVLAPEAAQIDSSHTAPIQNLSPPAPPLEGGESKTIVPAQGWVFNERGEVVLVAYDPTVTGPQRLKTNPEGCPTP